MDKNTLNDIIGEFMSAFLKLSEERQKEVLKYYDYHSSYSLQRMAKEQAERTISYADKHDYGYGECYYYLEEDINEFEEETPELAKEYKKLLYAYYNFLTENKNI